MSRRPDRVVWIINHYSTLPSRDGAGARHYKLAQELRVHGWKGVLFLASTRHPSGEQTLPRDVRRQVDTDGGVPYVMLRAPEYRGGLARVRNMVSFARGLLARRAVRGIPDPDVVIGSTVHLLAAWSALRLARRYRVPFVFEMRDIWPETLVDLGKLKAGSIAARLMSRVSYHLSSAADLVISPLPAVRSYLDDIGLGHIPFEWVSNGVDVPEEAAETARSSEVTEFTLMYLGSHGHANGLEGLLDAFELANTLPGASTLRLRLVGDGTLKEALKARAGTLASRNRIVFEDRVSRNDVLNRAREADALIVNIEDLPVYRFGVSLNKLFDYLASERPTIIASSAINDPIADAGAGISVPAGDVNALAMAIRTMSELPHEDRLLMGRRGLDHVRSRYTYAALAGKLAGALDSLIGDASDARRI